jgi:predicted ATPase
MSDERTANPTSTPIHTLPAQLTPLIGRAAELQALLAYLADTTTRLITLTGLGGVGKTRLALEVGWHSVADPQLRQRFADGIHFVSLAGVEEADQLPGVLAAALQLQLEPATLPATQLQHALRERRLLLILDNLDAVAVQADLLATLLQSAPNLTILATSRERLNLAGEWVVELDGLPLPATADADEERRSPASR